jgi:hypothetical protein
MRSVRSYGRQAAGALPPPSPCPIGPHERGRRFSTPRFAAEGYALCKTRRERLTPLTPSQPVTKAQRSASAANGGRLGVGSPTLCRRHTAFLCFQS